MHQGREGEHGDENRDGGGDRNENEDGNKHEGRDGGENESGNRNEYRDESGGERRPGNLLSGSLRGSENARRGATPTSN